MKKKVRQPRDLVVTLGQPEKKQKFTLGECTHDRSCMRSIRLHLPNEGHLLMGSRSAMVISKWLVRASDWVRHG